MRIIRWPQMHTRSLSFMQTTRLRDKLQNPTCYPEGLQFWPDYLTVEEQRILLKASLHKLDNAESIRSRRRRRNYQKPSPAGVFHSTNVHSIFLPDEYYEFQEGHYDGVIRGYREMHLTSWPKAEFEGLSSVLQRLHALCPNQSMQTHLLHLATRGYISPHIDNVHASGKWILGVSLGNERVLRLEPFGDDPLFDLPLPSGSVYIQSGETRYTRQHSIVHKPGGEAGQRLSIMMRDLPVTTGVS